VNQKTCRPPDSIADGLNRQPATGDSGTSPLTGICKNYRLMANVRI